MVDQGSSIVLPILMLMVVLLSLNPSFEQLEMLSLRDERAAGLKLGSSFGMRSRRDCPGKPDVAWSRLVFVARTVSLGLTFLGSKGPGLKFTVPQKYFGHFYVLAVLWTAVLLLVTWIYAYSTASLDSDSDPLSYMGSSSYREARISVFLLLLMEIQVTRRLWETIYVFKYSPGARMHIFGYLTGLFYYTAAPLTLCCNCAPEAYKFVSDGATEFIFKVKSEISAAGFDLRDLVDPLLKIGWCQRIGLVVVFWGWIHQYRCHAILGSLREHSEKSHSYAIPRGDWFEIVSSPHYLAEIVVYGGLVVASGGANLTVWLLFGFVVVNLAFAAGETHRWYLTKFDEYPRNRCAIIPYLY